ncbi:hypothetical protein EJD97_013353 [Solanum chilense]|uniref:Uncharacterized protein n=1 Tax=Solanum chilense TaxID=4083 RepID=A0A6N2BDJ7_SOLCI|nr:hypothetical protein EJD97_013353 [Solanum chilense]
MKGLGVAKHLSSFNIAKDMCSASSSILGVYGAVYIQFKGMQGWSRPASRRARMMGGCMSGGSSQGSTFRDMKEELTWKNKVMMVVKDNMVMIKPLILMNIRDEGSKRNVKRRGEHEEIGRSASLCKTVKMVCEVRMIRFRGNGKERVGSQVAGGFTFTAQYCGPK